MSQPSYEYDICLSFAGEQRSYVEYIADQLSSKEINVFYDIYEQANLWGKDLYEHLDLIYRQKARYCILFISADYATKVWTTHERRSAQTRALGQNEEYVLPARFDDTEIPGIRPTVGYIDLREISPAQLVSLVCAKLEDTDNSSNLSSAYVPTGVPRTSYEQRLLIDTKPLGWEYLLFGGVLVQGKAKLAPKHRDHEIRYPGVIRRVTDEKEALDLLGKAMNRGEKLIGEGVMAVLDPVAQEWAFGKPGTSGNVANIIHLGERFIDIYEAMYDWASDLRGTASASELERMFQLASQFMDNPLRQVGQFIDQYAGSLDGIPERLSNGEEIELELNLVLTIDDDVNEQLSREIKQVGRRRRYR